RRRKSWGHSVTPLGSSAPGRSRTELFVSFLLFDFPEESRRKGRAREARGARAALSPSLSAQRRGDAGRRRKFAARVQGSGRRVSSRSSRCPLRPPRAAAGGGCPPAPAAQNAVSPFLLCLDRPELYGLRPLPNRPLETRQESYGSNPICKGCLSCSKDNGCIRCQHKLFFFLRREGMRQYGECLHSCPSGYYGLRTPDMNRCSRCRIENCDSCFSRDFCTKCKAGFYSHRGRCFRGCPPGFAALEELMECVEGCEVGQWSEWGTCSRNNKTCGFKWGLETRTRQIVKKPAKDTIPCPTIAESRRCKMAVRHCPGGKPRACHKNLYEHSLTEILVL
uniref:R-spondin-2 n=1 Tax=Coturnix japonica TaxID=93934 RepID=A0A8C2Y738_COTJA